MSNFEKITASPEALGAFLQSLPVADGPWDTEFHKVFCAECNREDCDGEMCKHQNERSNPTCWLMWDTEDARADRKESDCVLTTHGEGAMEDMRRIGAAMEALGNMLISKDEKIRVTIECNPETGRYEFVREVLKINQ